MRKGMIGGLLALALVLPGGGLLAQPLAPGLSQGHWSGRAGIRTQRWQDGANYYLDIQVRGLRPQDVQVVPQWGGLVIRVARLQASRRETPGGLRIQGGSMTRIEHWVTTPPDADLAHMERRDLQGLVRIRIPRGGGW